MIDIYSSYIYMAVRFIVIVIVFIIDGGSEIFYSLLLYLYVLHYITSLYLLF